jgi:hypothetical protein
MCLGEKQQDCTWAGVGVVVVDWAKSLLLIH